TAGALAFGDAVRLVALRGELMERAWPSGYGMTAIMGLERSTVEALLAEVHGADSPVFLANVNAANQLVIAGSEAAMAAVGARARALGAGAVKRLAVSVPSHCALLDEPAAQLVAAFAQVEVRRPALRYLSSSSARLVMEPSALRDDLALNMCRLVDWQGTLRNAWERGVRLHIELPPGTVLSGLARRVMRQGTVAAFQGARLDTLVALLREEGCADR
ncbi:MAG: malonate decarboxylase subunit epsilon, partial [Pseudomonas sagittaria]|nr:malonate decarboxylase subunit epsilon [Pseudomonas sagittaria]